MDKNNLLGIPPTLLAAEPRVVEDLEKLGAQGAVAEHPESSLAWSVLADEARKTGPAITAYAYARVGYHRGLDSLRKSGWRGQGPVPWAHEPNRGVLRSFWLLQQAAEAIGETGEVKRLGDLLRDSDPLAAAAIESELLAD